LVLVQEQYQEGQGMLLVEWKMVEVKLPQSTPPVHQKPQQNLQHPGKSRNKLATKAQSKN
jgi:hypothetical protein